MFKRTSVALLAAAVLTPGAAVRGQTPPPAGQAPQIPQAAGPAPQVIEQVLVKVNGDIITKTDLEERQIAALRQQQASTPRSSRTTSS